MAESGIVPVSMSRRVARALLVAVSIALALSAVEAWLYAFGAGYDERFLMPDLVRGWRPRPNFAGWHAEENTLWVRINSDGLRDREHTRAKPPGTIRVAILGDSYMQAMNVPFEETFVADLERQLNICAAPRTIEVINFGVSGYGTAQERLTFQTQAIDYDPDVVITAIYFGNDLHNNYRPFNNDLLPFYIEEHGALTLDTSFAQELERSMIQPWRIRARMFLTDHSRVLDLLYRRSAELRQWRSPAPSTPRELPWDEEEDALQPPADQELADAWRITEAILLALAGDVRDSGAEPWFVSLSMAVQVDPDPERRATMRALMGVGDLFYPEQRLTALGAAHGVPTITLAPPLAEYAAANKTYIHGGMNRRVPGGMGHWNATGNRLGAEITARRLCAESPALRGSRAADPAR